MNYFSRLLLMLLLLAAHSGVMAAPNNAMVDAMQSMVDAMSDYVDDRRGRNPGFRELLNRGLEQRYGEEYDDLTILYRNMPGAPPRSAASRTQLLDGIWTGRRGAILMIRDGLARIFAYSYAHFEDAEIYLNPPLLQIRNLNSGMMREFNYAYRGGKLALRGESGNILLYRRLEKDRRYLRPLRR